MSECQPQSRFCDRRPRAAVAATIHRFSFAPTTFALCAGPISLLQTRFASLYKSSMLWQTANGSSQLENDDSACIRREHRRFVIQTHNEELDYMHVKVLNRLLWLWQSLSFVYAKLGLSLGLKHRLASGNEFFLSFDHLGSARYLIFAENLLNRCE